MEYPNFNLQSALVLERAEVEDGTPAGPQKFKATFARRDTVDSDGLLIQPAAFAEQEGESIPLIRYHGKDPASGLTTLGAGRIHITREEAYVSGELHDTMAAQEFAREFMGLQNFDLGECSIGGAVPDGKLRRSSEAESKLGAKSTAEKGIAREISFAVRGKMENSNFELVRALDMPAEQNPEEAAILARVQETLDRIGKE